MHHSGLLTNNTCTGRSQLSSTFTPNYLLPFNVSSPILKFKNALRQTLLLVFLEKVIRYCYLPHYQALENSYWKTFLLPNSLYIFFYIHVFIYIAHAKSENLKVMKIPPQNHKIKILIFHFCYDSICEFKFQFCVLTEEKKQEQYYCFIKINF